MVAVLAYVAPYRQASGGAADQSAISNGNKATNDTNYYDPPVGVSSYGRNLWMSPWHESAAYLHLTCREDAGGPTPARKERRDAECSG
jgi:hypothetical protein